MIHPVFRCFLLRLIQHALGEIDTDDLAMAGVHRQGQAGPDSHFEDFFMRLDVQILNDRLAAFVKHFSEYPIVDFGVRRIDTLDLR